MNTQSTRCAGEELAELEEWLKSKGVTPVEKGAEALQPGEYVKALNEPKDKTSAEPPTWTVTWYPKEAD